MNEVSVSREIAAPAEQVWDLIADVTRMGEWSPETTRGTWLRGAAGPALGARFRGVNRNGARRWFTTAEVTACERGHEFTFDVRAGGLEVARWRYTFEPTPPGCRVTETWIDQRGRVVTTLGAAISGVSDRAEHNRAGMEETLRRVAEAAET